jgi:hypothetical protein
MITSELAVAGPGVVGATGGSGTRAVARILRQGGLFIGSRLNDSEDAVDLGEYSDVWINAFVSFRTRGVPDQLAKVMRVHLRAILSTHCTGALPEQKWGWKEPRSIFLLPFLHEALPTLRFLHVVRDGRDMALSENQNQLRKHGGAYLGRPTDARSPLDSIELWARLNLETARYGAERLEDRYLRIRYEDLCSDPVSTASDVFGFFGLDGDPEVAAREVRRWGASGRWTAQDPAAIAQLEQRAGEALREFGYITG